MFWNTENLGEIDPTELNKDTSPLAAKKMRALRRFLIQNKAYKKFYKKKPYSITLDGTRFQFTLSHDILHRAHENIEQDRFEVISNDLKPIGEGGSGRFHKIEGTLTPELNGKLIYKNKNRGVKREIHPLDKEEVKKQARHEYKMTKKVSSRIAAKKPVIITEEIEQFNAIKGQTEKQEKEVSYTTMHLLPGEDLDEVLKKHYMYDCRVINLPTLSENTKDNAKQTGIPVLHINQSTLGLSVYGLNLTSNEWKEESLGQIDPGTLEKLLKSEHREKLQYAFEKFPNFKDYYELTPPLSKLALFNLTTQLLRQLQEQFHDKGIIHLDLKPKNIKYDKDTEEVTIFDLGASQHLNNITNKASGTYDYMSPEQQKICNAMQNHRNNPQAFKVAVSHISLNEKTDVYNMGKTLLEIWNLKAPTDETKNSAILKIIIDMCKHEQDSRISIEEALSRFEILKIDELHKDEKPSLKKEIVVASKQGLKTWESCRKLISNPLQTKMKGIIHTINGGLNKINDEEKCVEAFVDSLGVNAFKGLKTKKSIEDKLDAIKTEFSKQKNASIQNEISLNYIMRFLIPDNKSRFYKLMKSIHDELQHVGLKYKELSPGIDQMVTLTKNMKKANDKISQRLSNLDDVYQNAKQLPGLKDVVTELMKNDEKHPCKEIRNRIKYAVITYLDKSYTKSTMHKQDRAASQRRLTDMLDILQIANDDATLTSADVIDNINTRLAAVEGGLLQTNIFYRKIGFGSDLVKNIESAIEDYQDTVKNGPRSKL